MASFQHYQEYHKLLGLHAESLLRIPVWDTATRPSGGDLIPNILGINTDLTTFPTLEWYDGVDWQSSGEGYTNEKAQDAAASLIQNGTGISWSYDDTANTLTPTISLSAFTTTNLSEGTNQYFTNARARTAISLTTTGSGAATYNNSTGVLNIPTPGASIAAEDGSSNISITNASAYGAVTFGDHNIVIGDGLLTALTIGDNNVAIGQNVFNALVSIPNCVGIGEDLFKRLTGGGGFYGSESGSTIAIGKNNGPNSIKNSIVIGYQNLQTNPTTSEIDAGSTYDHIIIGWRCLQDIIDGIDNIAIGYDTMADLVTGSKNNAIGEFALTSFTSGDRNQALGWFAGANLTTGSDNIFIGDDGGNALNSGAYNQCIFIGNAPNTTGAGLTNLISIGHAVTSGNASNAVYLGNTSILNTYLRGTLNMNTAPSAYSSGGYDVLGRNQTSGNIEAITVSGGVTINNNTDNYIVTASGTANTLNGEANFIYNGSYTKLTNGFHWIYRNSDAGFYLTNTNNTDNSWAVTVLSGGSLSFDLNTDGLSVIGNRLTISSAGVLVGSNNWVIPASAGMYFDGGTNDYISQNSVADTISVFTGGTERVRFNSSVMNFPTTPSTYSSGGRKMLVRNDTSGNVEVETVPTGGGGIALTDLSAVAPLSYNSGTGAFTTSIATSKLVGRTTASTGVMEEISVSGGLSLSSGTLSAVGLSPMYVVAASDAPTAIKNRADYICDGTADESEINTALALGNVQLTQGTYNISTTGISMPNNTTLQGVGDSTILKGISYLTSTKMIQASGTTGIRLRDFQIDGNTQTVGYGIYLVGVGTGNGSTATTGFEISGIYGKNIYQSVIEVRNCRNGIIRNNRCTNVNWDFIVLRSSGGTTATGNQNIVVADNQSNNATGSVWCQLSDHITFTGNNFEGDYANANGQMGFQIESTCTYINITGNTVRKMANWGIYLSDTYYSTVADNVVDGTFSAEGIYITVGEKNVISGNNISNCATHGITADAPHTLVVGNNIHDNSVTTNNTSSGIQVTSNNVSVIGNVVTKGTINTNKQKYGIQITAAGTNCIVQGNILYDAGSTGDLFFTSNTPKSTARLKNNIDSSGNYLGDDWFRTSDLTPAQITAQQDNYNPTNYVTNTNILRLSTDASRIITGLTGGADGRMLAIFNVGSNNIVLQHDDGATSTAANRFKLPGAANITLTPGQPILLYYDSTDSRWRSLANVGSGTSSSSGYTIHSITNADSPYTITETSGEVVILANATAGSITINLPAASGNTAKYTVKKTNTANSVTLDGNASETIDGGTTAVVSTQYESITIVNDNSNWYVI